MHQTLIPRPEVPVQHGKVVSRSWYTFFSKLIANTGFAPIVVTVGASPYSYTAESDGSLLVLGGTVSDTTITRVVMAGMTATPYSVPAGTNGIFPLSAGDTATITYTVAPTVTFIPT